MAVPLTLKVFKGESSSPRRTTTATSSRSAGCPRRTCAWMTRRSRRIHSVIEVAADGTLSIIDMGSVEGTYVNGKRVNKGALSFGDEIRSATPPSRSRTPAAAGRGEPRRRRRSARTPLRRRRSRGHRSASPGRGPRAVALAAPPAPLAAAGCAVPLVPPPSANARPRARRPRRRARPSARRSRARRAPRPQGQRPAGRRAALPLGRPARGRVLPRPGPKQSLHRGQRRGRGLRHGRLASWAPRVRGRAQPTGTAFTVRFTGKMKGELQPQRDETLDLEGRRSSPARPSHEGDAYALTLEADDFAWVDLGGVTLEVCFQPVPKRGVRAARGVGRLHRPQHLPGDVLPRGALRHRRDEPRPEGDEFADELNGNQARIAKLIIKPPETQKNPFLEKLNEQKEKQPARRPRSTAATKARWARRTRPSQRRTPRPRATRTTRTRRAASPRRSSAARAALSTIFGHRGPGRRAEERHGQHVRRRGGRRGRLRRPRPARRAARAAAARVTPSASAASAPRAAAAAPAATAPASACSAARRASTSASPRRSRWSWARSTRSSSARSSSATRSQIRYCYESLLNRYPKLNGKVAVKFIIGAGWPGARRRTWPSPPPATRSWRPASPAACAPGCSPSRRAAAWWSSPTRSSSSRPGK